MFVQGFGKGMAAAAIGHEIKITRIGWIEDRFERSPAGVGDGSGRQAVNLVGIVGRVGFQIVLGQTAIKLALAAHEPINRRRV